MKRGKGRTVQSHKRSGEAKGEQEHSPAPTTLGGIQRSQMEADFNKRKHFFHTVHSFNHLFTCKMETSNSYTNWKVNSTTRYLKTQKIVGLHLSQKIFKGQTTAGGKWYYILVLLQYFPNVFHNGHCQRWNAKVHNSFVLSSRTTHLPYLKFGPSVAPCVAKMTGSE